MGKAGTTNNNRGEPLNEPSAVRHVSRSTFPCLATATSANLDLLVHVDNRHVHNFPMFFFLHFPQHHSSAQRPLAVLIYNASLLLLQRTIAGDHAGRLSIFPIDRCHVAL